MGRYVKSHSNYLLKAKHQEISDGIIYERDITTIGGRDHFAKGQIPIYKSGNFVITVNNDNTAYKKIPSGEWKGNGEGDVWTLDILKNYEKDEKSSYDKKIVIKKDYYDLRDFAYFGSCSELIRTSVNNIIDKFHGELFVPYVDVWVFYPGEERETKIYSLEAAKKYATKKGIPVPPKTVETISVKYTDYSAELPTISNFKLPNTIDGGKNATLFVIDNPFFINIHSNAVPNGEDPIKYFANGGIDNYVAYTKDKNGEWDFKNPLKIVSNGFVDYHKVKAEFEVNYQGEVQLKKEKQCQGEYCPGDFMGYVDLSFIGGKDISSVSGCSGENVEVSFNVSDKVVCNVRVYVFMGDNNEIKYFFDPVYSDGKYSCFLNIRIRPKDEIVEDFYDNLNYFENILLDRTNDYEAMFEVIKDSDYGYYIDTERFKFPTTYGGFNLGSKGSAFSEYIERLVKIGEYYDERFTDNLWRSMTHEAIRNFDWTYTRHFNPGDEIPYVEGGSKIQKIIRLYGREFDETRSYIDAIADCNTITYDNINNLPDYFFSDKLEDDGWDVRLVNPFDLKEYTYDNKGVKTDVTGKLSKDDEISNTYDEKHVERVFTEDYGVSSIKPYSEKYITSLRWAKCGEYLYLDTGESGCTDEMVSLNVKAEYNSALNDTYDFRVNASDVCTDGTINLSPEKGESQKGGYHDDCCNDIKIYSTEKEYTSSDVNSEFLKRFILNSKSILRNKGTKNGIEMLLALFGLRSKDYVYSNDSYFRVETDKTTGKQKLVLSNFGKKYYKKTDLYTAMAFDYDVKEYTMFTTRFEDEYKDDKQMYYMDWINSNKLTSYNTPEYRSGRYVSYQGLPVAYRLKNENKEHPLRYIYPSFQNYFQYDGGLYYQMNGGWLSKNPFMYDTKNNIVPVNYSSDNNRNAELFTETVKNVKCVQTLDELLSNSSLGTNTGDICQVVDLSGTYAIIDGLVYNLLKEDGFYYFYVPINNNGMSVGNAYFTDFVYISNPFAENKLLKIDLSDDTYNGKSVRVYLIKDSKGQYDVDIHSNSSSISTFTMFENGKYMEGDNFTHYFRINNPDFSNELSVLGWQQLRDDEYEYYIMDSINDYNKGNNPHNGHNLYDKGHEYLNRFAHLFKPIYEGGLFNPYYEDSEDIDIYEKSKEFGFSNLVSTDECYKNYDQYLYEDDKCHFFGDLLTKDGKCYKYSLDNFKTTNYTCNGKVEEIYMTGDSKYRCIGLDESSYRKTPLNYGEIKNYHYGKSNCGDDAPGTKDGVTNQIVNTKRVDIDFYLNSAHEYSVEWLEEVKYIDAVILPYLTQIIPSNIILTVNYKKKINKPCSECEKSIKC